MNVIEIICNLIKKNLHDGEEEACIFLNHKRINDYIKRRQMQINIDEISENRMRWDDKPSTMQYVFKIFNISQLRWSSDSPVIHRSLKEFRSKGENDVDTFR